jgi:hypothetical protein
MEIDFRFDTLSYEERTKLNKFYRDIEVLLSREESPGFFEELHGLASDYVGKLFIDRYNKELEKENG